jgi:phosphoesterase RecJ-like protein
MELLEKDIARLSEIIETAEPRKVAVVSHFNPDGDAIGSTLAWRRLLLGMGHDVECVVPNKFPGFLSWIEDVEKIRIFKESPEESARVLKQADVIFFLDLNNVSRLEEDMAEAINSNQKATKVLIDHHPQPSDGFDVLISHPEACSTAELVFRVIVGLSGADALSYEMAQCIYTGMMTDTGAFAYASARKDIYLIIAELLGKGIDKDLIYRKVFYNASVSKMRLWGFAMYDKLKVYNKYNAALITLSHDELMRFYAGKGDTEGLVNQPLQIKGVRLSCFLREEQPGKVNVSLRSVDDFPCNELAAEFFNGGGHKNASGGELYATMGMAVERFKQAIQKYKALLTE